MFTWVNESHYLGIFIVSTLSFKISLEHAKRSFFRAANVMFGKVGHITSEDVLMQLVKIKCLLFADTDVLSESL